MQAQAEQSQTETIEVYGKEYRGHWVPIGWDEFSEDSGERCGPSSLTESLYLSTNTGAPVKKFVVGPSGATETYFRWIPEPAFDQGHQTQPIPEGAVSSTPKPTPPAPLPPPAFNVFDLLNLHDDLCDEARGLMERKNNDYAGEDGTSPFKNFLHAETLGLCSVEQGMVVRLSDKLQRLAHAVSGQEMKVTDESIRDTILDIINYSVLISAYLKSKVQASS